MTVKQGNRKPAYSQSRHTKAWISNPHSTKFVDSKEYEDTALPDWIKDRYHKVLGSIVLNKYRDIWQYEQEEVRNLYEKIRAFPELAALLPAEFCEKISHCCPRELSAIERAIILIIAVDRHSFLQGIEWSPVTLAEIIKAEFEAIAFALKEGGTK